jgi:hypothetical protein
VVLWDHEIGTASVSDGTDFVPGRTTVALRAPGCDDATLDVGHDLPSVTVTMTCPGRP